MDPVRERVVSESTGLRSDGERRRSNREGKQTETRREVHFLAKIKVMKIIKNEP